MARKKFLVIIGILLIGAMVAFDGVAETISKKSQTPRRQSVSKNSQKKATQKKAVKSRPAKEPQKLVLRSFYSVVEDQRTGEFLVQKNAKTVVPVASITKLMTAMVVLDAQMDLQERIVIGQEDIDTLRHSRSRLPVGTRLSREDALLLALMASENRAAHALGRTYPGGLDAFVAAMNQKARLLGLSQTHFTDPTGLSGKNVSCAEELATMVDAAYVYPLIREFSTREAAMIQLGHRKRAFRNTNTLVRSSRWQIGLSKTGFIDEAGRCLVMQAQVAQRPVVIVLLDAQGKQTRFGDANRIKQWMERQFAARTSQKG